MRRQRWTTGLVLALVTGLGLGVMSGGATAGAAEPDRARTVSGWFGNWHTPTQMADVAKRSGRILGEVNIFLWSYRGPANPVCTIELACPSPSATPWTTSEMTAATKALQSQGVAVYATHTDLDADLSGSLSAYLAKKKNRTAIAKRLTDWAVAAGVDGVDLDWENFAFNDGSSSWGATRPRFTKTIALLSSSLHSAGLKLSVTVPGGYQPFRSDGTPNPGGGYTVYDWAALAPLVDRLRLMTYDYSWDRPGPIGPHWWAKQSVKSAVAQVGDENRHKIYVGLHQYGKAWYVRDADDDYVTEGDCPDSWVPTGPDRISMTPAEARSLAADYGVTPTLDRRSRERTFTYVKSEGGRYTNSNGKSRSRDCQVRKQVWFGSTDTAVGRMSMVKKQRIGGVAVWHLAMLDDGFFSSVQPYLKAAKKQPAKKQAADQRNSAAGVR